MRICKAAELIGRVTTGESDGSLREKNGSRLREEMRGGTDTRHNKQGKEKEKLKYTDSTSSRFELQLHENDVHHCDWKPKNKDIKYRHVLYSHIVS